MRLISMKSIQPGNTLVFPIIGIDGRRILSENTVLTDFYIRRLEEMGLKFVYILDERFNTIACKMPMNADARVKAIMVYKKLQDEIIKDKNINEDSIKEIVKVIVDDVKSSGAPVIVSNYFYPESDYLANHAVNTAIISTCIGIQLSYNYNQLCDVCMAGFIHDIGRKSLTDDDKEIHTQKGFEALRKTATLGITSTAVVYQHHENFNGSGFPRGIEGQKISEYTRIVSVADCFDTVSATSLSQEKAYDSILNDTNVKLDPEMVKAFKGAIQIYYNGMQVLLNDGRQGIIQSQNKGYPLRPLVRLFSEGDPEYSEIIDLKEELHVSIIKILI